MSSVLFILRTWLVGWVREDFHFFSVLPFTIILWWVGKISSLVPRDFKRALNDCVGAFLDEKNSYFFVL
ncbi:MAG: hypothetical protein ACTID0_07180, partial [Leuconostoc mesenteroides]